MPTIRVPFARERVYKIAVEGASSAAHAAALASAAISTPFADNKVEIAQAEVDVVQKAAKYAPSKAIAEV